MFEANHSIATSEMKDQLKIIISKVKEDPNLIHTITDESDLIKEVGLTSLNLMRVMLEIEDEFDMEIDLKKIKSIKIFSSLNNLCEFLQSMK